MKFVMNGITWRVYFVSPSSSLLTDRTGSRTVATTDGRTKSVYLSDDLYGEFLKKVFIHELGHCVIISFDLLDEIEKMVKPQFRIYAEEWICNFLADYGEMIFDTLYDVLGDKTIHVLPYEMARIIA